MTAPAAPRSGSGPAGGGPAVVDRVPRPAELDALVFPAAAAGAAALALTSTGAMVVAAVLLGISTRSRWSTLAAVLATAAVSARFSTAVFDDVAGIQSVLGIAGRVGPPVAAASAWVAAGAVLLAVRPLPGASGPGRLLPAVAAGALAAAIVAGPGPGGGLGVRVVATVVAVAIAVLVAAADGRLRVVRLEAAAVVAGVVAVVLASWPG